MRLLVFVFSFSVRTLFLDVFNFTKLSWKSFKMSCNASDGFVLCAINGVKTACDQHWFWFSEPGMESEKARVDWLPDFWHKTGE